MTLQRWSPVQLALTLLVGAALWLLAAGLALMVGSSTQSMGWPTPDLLGIRAEPMLLASLVGAALGAAGVAYQAILRNPLADPYLLGVSTGASLFSFLWQLSASTFFLQWMSASAGAVSQQLFSFVGATLAVGLVLLLSGARGRIEPVTLLLVGVIVNAVNTSIFLLLNYLIREQPGGGGPMAFLVGGIHTTITREHKLAVAAIVAAGFIALLWLSGRLHVASLGESEAMALGVRIHRLRWTGLILASLITASAVALSGPIGFIGLVCPHLARVLVGNDTRRLLPASTIAGAALLALADAASRYLAAQGRTGVLLPVGVLTGLLGGPFFLLLLWQNRRREDRRAAS